MADQQDDAHRVSERHPLTFAIADASLGMRALSSARQRMNHQIAQVREFARSRNPNMSLFDRELNELVARVAEVIKHEKRLLLPDERDQHELRTLRQYVHDLEVELGHATSLVKDLLHHNKRIARFEERLSSLRDLELQGAKKLGGTTGRALRSGVDLARDAISTVSRRTDHEQLRNNLSQWEAQYIRLKHTSTDSSHQEHMRRLESKMRTLKDQLESSRTESQKEPRQLPVTKTIQFKRAGQRISARKKKK